MSNFRIWLNQLSGFIRSTRFNARAALSSIALVLLITNPPASAVDETCVVMLRDQPKKELKEIKKTSKQFKTSLAEYKSLFSPLERVKPAQTFPAAIKVKPSLLSAESGREKLSAIRIVLGPGFTFDLFGEYLMMMQQMPELKLMVLVGDSESKRATSILRPVPKQVRERVSLIRVKEVPSGGWWTQDGSKPIVASKPTSLVSKIEDTDRKELKQTLNIFKSSGLLNLQKSAFNFAGGNVIVGDQHIFTGIGTAARLMDLYKVTHSEALKIMEVQWGKPVVEVGVGYHGASYNGAPMQLDFHIDLTMAVVYSPVKNKEVVILGSAQDFLDRISGIAGSEFENPTGQNLLGSFFETQNTRKLAMREAMLPFLERDLKALGYETLRVPYWGRGDTPIINYTNVILSDGQIIIPDNGFGILDQAMSKLFSDLGYKGIPIQAVQKSLQSNGGLRCLSETFRFNRVEQKNHI